MCGEFQNETYHQYESGATFVRRCKKCCRFVKPDEFTYTSEWDGRLKDAPNATCSKCGRTEMIFLGFM